MLRRAKRWGIGLFAMLVLCVSMPAGAALAAQKKEGWAHESGWSYYYVNGKKLTGFHQLAPANPPAAGTTRPNGTPWFYFNEKATKDIPLGAMIGENHVIDGVTYYLHEDGLYRGWYWGDYYDIHKKQTVYFYCYGQDTGQNSYGWIYDSGPFKERLAWRYLIKENTMATGWQKISHGGQQRWFYFRRGSSDAHLDGSMVTGWQQISYKGKPSWFYFGGSGAMQTGWQKIVYKGSPQWFYFNSSGVMQTGKHTIAGKPYTFNSAGVWLP